MPVFGGSQDAVTARLIFSGESRCCDCHTQNSKEQNIFLYVIYEKAFFDSFWFRKTLSLLLQSLHMKCNLWYPIRFPHSFHCRLIIITTVYYMKQPTTTKIIRWVSTEKEIPHCKWNLLSINAMDNQILLYFEPVYAIQDVCSSFPNLLDSGMNVVR